MLLLSALNAEIKALEVGVHDVVVLGMRITAWANSVMRLPCVTSSLSTHHTLLGQAEIMGESYLVIIFYNHKC